MTALALNQKFNQIASLASKLAAPLTPFFFVKQNSDNFLLQLPKLAIKVNRQMSPMLASLPETTRLGFWSSAQFENLALEAPMFEKSIVINPFKTQKLIRSALNKGIRKMIVADVEELTKIQKSYFKLRKQGAKIKEPEYIWAVENSDCDLGNLIDLQKCQLPINGLYFSPEMPACEIQKFLENKAFKNKPLDNFRETTKQNLSKEHPLLQSHSLSPMLTNYSQTSSYLMVCRIIGKDRKGTPVFDDSCLDFICKLDTCSCERPNVRIQYRFEAGGFQWAALRPARLDKLRSQHVVE